MPREYSRRRLLASTGLLASGLALGSAAGAPAGTADELPLRWNRAYAESTANTVVAAVESGDQYVVLGRTGSQNSLVGWLFGLDRTTGEQRWSVPVRNDDLDTQPSFTAAAPTGDGGAVLAAYGTGSAYLVRTDAMGAIEWWRQYDPGSDDGILLTQDVVRSGDGFLVGGYRIAGQSATAVALRVGPDGAEQTRSTFFADRTSTILGLLPREDGFVAAGELREQPTGDEQPPVRGNLFRVTTDGSVGWQRTLTAPFDGETGQTQLRDVVPIDGGFLTVGIAIGPSGSSFQGWGVATDDSGVEQTNRRLAPRQATLVTDATVSADGVTIVGQALESPTSQTGAGFVAELAPTVEPRWVRTFSPNDISSLATVLGSSDGGVVTGGTIQPGSRTAEPRPRGWVLKLGGDSAPDAPTNIETQTPTATPTMEPPTAVDPSPTPTASPTPTPTASPMPTASPSPTPTPTDAVTDTATATDEGGPETPGPGTETSSDGGPGFGVGAAAAALGASALWYRSRADDEE